MGMGGWQASVGDEGGRMRIGGAGVWARDETASPCRPLRPSPLVMSMGGRKFPDGKIGRM